ncbi:alpha/beta hydrolase [Kribbella italica]|uniref:Pimeloyl-ACP methyl ester carboxylesterase n=1 Tax=Kribbella italica TaxID=1540520 RepID=A0A7W9MZR5_9ACTN|nr:alpha/beta hydrolase [Kribbella italica]MBB5841518.1 pimeloyl-ACP methyl ester carboxylesterase [Kribbella italica]
MKLTVPLAIALLGSVLAVPTAAEATPSIRWHQCQTTTDDQEGKALDDAGAQCGDLRVPLDYSRPNGPQITVAMSRLKATDRRIGAMVLNDGGPGGPGLGMPLRLKKAMQETGGRFDLIGMDPRFVGRSTPIDCGWSTGSWIVGAGASRASFERGARFSAGLAEQCKDNPYLPYASTRNTARDIDRIRAALGERRISYLSYSYGTYLGAVYAQLFPQRLDRVVLDGPIDPEAYGPGLLREIAPENEAALKAWAGWAAARHSTYGLGRSREQVLGTIDRIQAAAADGLKVGKYDLDDGWVPALLLANLADDREPARAGFSELVRTLSQATTGPVEPTGDTALMLQFMFTGEMSAPASGQLAILCADRAVSSDLGTYWRDIQKHRRAEPHFGPLTRTVTPCAFWPTTPRETPTRIGNGVPALVVAADGDPRATYPMARKLHRALTGSRMITVRDARKHGIFGEHGNDCADRKVIDYLATGKLPRIDSNC